MIYQKGSIFHIYNRGCNKNNIFYNIDNYDYLIKKIIRSYKKFNVSIIAFCLMPNHYHFLLRQDSEIPISQWLRSLFIGYTLAINKQQNRAGTLFSGRSKARLINDEKYFQHLIFYIHHNPVKTGFVAKMEDWEYSNYHECIGIRNKYPYNKSIIEDSFGSQMGYMDFSQTYLDEPIIDGLEKYLFD